MRTWEIVQFAKKYGLTVEQVIEIVRVQEELAEYRTTYKAK